MNEQQEERMRTQIKETFHKAWRDVLEAKVREEPPDYDWIVRLYTEMRHNLTYFLKKGSAFRTEIEESLDIELFDQMIRHGAFKGQEFYNLVCYVFDLCLKLGSPARDKDVNKLKDEVLESLKNSGVFAILVPLFFKNINICIEWIHKDLSLVPEELKKIVNSKK